MKPQNTYKNQPQPESLTAVILGTIMFIVAFTVCAVICGTTI